MGRDRTFNLRLDDEDAHRLDYLASCNAQASWAHVIRMLVQQEYDREKARTAGLKRHAEVPPLLPVLPARKARKAKGARR